MKKIYEIISKNFYKYFSLFILSIFILSLSLNIWSNRNNQVSSEVNSLDNQTVEFVISSANQLENFRKDWCIENLNKTLNFVKLQSDFQNQDLENYFIAKLETNNEKKDLVLLETGVSLFKSIEYKQFKNSFEREPNRFNSLLEVFIQPNILENEVDLLNLMLGLLENSSILSFDQIDRIPQFIEIANQCYVWYELNN